MIIKQVIVRLNVVLVEVATSLVSVTYNVSWLCLVAETKFNRRKNKYKRQPKHNGNRAKLLLANRLLNIKIMPIDYSKYPPNWDEIRQRILERAKNKCECCGLKNNTIVSSFKNHQNVVIWVFQDYAKWMRSGCPKRVRVVLTVAHLDHDETNHDVKDDRLKAMCQLCHLRYDSEEKKRRKNLKQAS